MHTYRRVNYQDRCQILAFLQAKVAVQEIAQILGFNKSTIYREMSRNGPGGKYEPKEAEARYRHRFKHCKRPYLIKDYREGVVLYLLFSDLSPEQISGRLKLEKGFSISHQSIYNYVYRQYRSLTPYLRRYNRRGASRVRMKAHKSTNKLGISNRPEIANKRSRIGDWERDSMYGAKGNQLLVCADRKSRLIKIGRVTDKKVISVNKLTANILSSTGKPIHTITNDNGPEFRYSHGLVAPVYYCHPRKPQQRGTVENAIGLIRQYIKRKTDLSALSDEDLQAVENCINFRPRKCLDYKTPYEVFYGTNVALAT
ncbi:IS30 family transposase [bacterium]|nr:IS30 family transposase [bacterium]